MIRTQDRALRDEIESLQIKINNLESDLAYERGLSDRGISSHTTAGRMKFEALGFLGLGEKGRIKREVGLEDASRNKVDMEKAQGRKSTLEAMKKKGGKERAEEYKQYLINERDMPQDQVESLTDIESDAYRKAEIKSLKSEIKELKKKGRTLSPFLKRKLADQYKKNKGADAQLSMILTEAGLDVHDLGMNQWAGTVKSTKGHHADVHVGQNEVIKVFSLSELPEERRREVKDRIRRRYQNGVDGGNLFDLAAGIRNIQFNNNTNELIIVQNKVSSLSDKMSNLIDSGKKRQAAALMKKAMELTKIKRK